MKRIATAASKTIQLSIGREVIVQEFTAFQAVKVIGKFRKILATLKERDVLNLSQLRTEDDNLDLSKVIDWADVVMEITENNFDDLVDIIAQSTVADSDTGHAILKRGNKIDEEGNEIGGDFVDLPIGEVVELAKAVYVVNVEEGSLKKSLGFLTKQAETTETQPETSNESSTKEPTLVVMEASD